MNPVYEKNLKLIHEGIACTNKKPISCYSGGAPASVIQGHTVADMIENPMLAVQDNLDMFKRLEEDAGGVKSLNSCSGSMNMVVLITLLWYSKVMIPGKEISENSVWQVKEQKLIDTDAYDEILSMGYNNFIQQKIMPRIIDMDYFAKYMKFAADHAAEAGQAFIDAGIPKMQAGNANMVPFEQLCGMRSMTKFYMDCYKRMDKLKEVSDFIFAETGAAMEQKLIAQKDNPTWIGAWVGGWRTAPGLLNPKIWKVLVWPYMKASAEQMLKYGKTPIMHLDQSWDREIEHFAELPAGKIVLNLDGMTDMARARKLLPGYALMGDVPATLLTTGTPEQVSDYVKKLIDDCGPEGLFVCPGCDCPVGAKYENIAAMVKTTNEWA